MIKSSSPYKTLLRPAETAITKDWRGVIIGCVIICAIGIAVRIPLLTKGGYTADFNYFTSWANAINDNGLTKVYNDSHISPNYPVGFMYLLQVLNGFTSIDKWTAENIHKPFKILLCISDVLITLCLILGVYWLGTSSRNSLLIGACYILNPAIIMVTGVWGQTNAIAIGVMIAGLIVVCTRYWLIGYMLAALACNIKLQVVPFVPLILLATIFLHHRDNWKSHLKALGLGMLFFLIIVLLLFIPFIYSGTADEALSEGYSSHFASDPALNRNAWNPWIICTPPEQDILNTPPLLVQLGRRLPWLAPISGLLTYWRISVLLFGAVCFIAFFGFAWKPSKQRLFFAASIIAVAFFFLMTKIHERYLLDAIPLLLLAAAFDPRAFGLCGIISIISALNVKWGINLLGPLCIVILGLVLLRTLLVVLSPYSQVRWLWDIGLKRKRLLDPPTITYIAAICLFLIFICPWSVWFSNLTRPHILYCDELELLEYSSKTYCPFRSYRIPDNTTLVIEGNRADYGFATTANSAARFALPKGYDFFTATIGISDDIPNASNIRIRFLVILDDKAAYRSEGIGPSTPGTNIEIPLGKAKTMALMVLDANENEPKPSSENCRYAVWLNPSIQKDF